MVKFRLLLNLLYVNIKKKYFLNKNIKIERIFLLRKYFFRIFYTKIIWTMHSFIKF